jgi:hypothetical protein
MPASVVTEMKIDARVVKDMVARRRRQPTKCVD